MKFVTKYPMQPPKNYNIAHTLDERAVLAPERTALIARSFWGAYRHWTFTEVRRLADAYAHGLTKQGVKSGDRVMLMVRPSLEFVALAFALFKLRAVIILIDPGMGYKNLLRCIARVRPEVFIGILKAFFFKTIFSRPFAGIRVNIGVGPGSGLFGKSLSSLADFRSGNFLPREADENDLAAIIFTTGSTGPPKGVQYTHGIFHAQLGLIRDSFGITAEDIDQPAFPLFALFSTALGACAVIPDMDPARPAQVCPKRFIRSIIDHGVTYSFGSPAIWNVVSRYCLEKKICLSSLKKVLMAGAPVSGELIDRVKGILPPHAEIYTPYGATEALPITCITGSEVLGRTWEETRRGKGTCVGRPLPGMEIRIIRAIDGPFSDWGKTEILPPYEIGEIVVRGPVVTKAYDHNEEENRCSKIRENNEVWHRMGDMGYLDETGRLWFCGRKAHRVVTAVETLYTIPCEAVFNQHPAVFRSALVGVANGNARVPVLIVEPVQKINDPGLLIAELRRMGQEHTLTRSIKHFLIHPSFPVDIRHNVKIFREKLAVWAASRYLDEV